MFNHQLKEPFGNIMGKQTGYKGRKRGISGRQKRLGRAVVVVTVGGCIIELSAQWSDGGHVVPLMEEEMSFLAKLIVQKRAVLLFREAPASLPLHLHAHITRTVKHTFTRVDSH